MAETDINTQQQGGQPSPEGGRPSGPSSAGQGGGGLRFNFFWIYLLLGVGLFAIYLFSQGSGATDLSYTDFGRLAERGYFTEIRISPKAGTATGQLRQAPSDSLLVHEPFRRVAQAYQQARERGKQYVVETSIPSTDKMADDVAAWQERQGPQFSTDIRYERSGGMLEMLWTFGSPLLLLFFLWFFMFRGMGNMGGAGGIFGVGKSKAQLYEKGNKTGVTFANVAGLSEAKQEVQEIVDFLKNPDKYTALGGKIPKGALLVGPPGTGKTLLAKAVAGEADVPFFSMSGSDFVEMFVGVGASRVRDLFARAKEKAPCIIFIDEIDAVGRARERSPQRGGNDERENTLNQLLTEMDGFGTNSGVIILAATNRADILDKALLRAGRFDRQIHVDLPELNDRLEIFQVHLKPLHLAEAVDVERLARQTPGFSGADIANVCNEAALIAARGGKESVGMDDFNNAIDRIIGGLEKKSKVMTRDEKHAIAIHEAGHATISWHLRYAAPLVKVTIVPRGNALGAAWYMPEERQINTKEQMLDELCALLGGRAAEQLFLGHVSSGAANDLERTTKQAYAMVVYYGMSDRLPNVCYYDSTGQDYGFTKPYSDERARVIDEEVSRIITEQYERAKTLLLGHAEGHAALAGVLEDREVIFTEDVEKIFGPRPWASRNDEIKAQSAAAAGPAAGEARPADGAPDNATETETNA